MVEDYSVFFADFGEDGALNGVPVRVIFDSPADEFAGPSGIVGQSAHCTIATDTVPAAVQGMVLELPRGRFTVRQHLPDGTGISRLLLSKAGA